MQGAYPGAALLPDDQGVWLLAHSRILDGLAREAIFLIALPRTHEIQPRGWAFWAGGGQLDWIGPRHTNFFDGSVCAYHPVLDNAWAPGDDLRTLLDIYSVWALRHLHLTVVGRWPGRQYAMPNDAGESDPYYRLLQFQPDELCSCGSDLRYGDCCRSRDLQFPLLTIKAAFERRNQGRSILDRGPPAAIVGALTPNGPNALPAIVQVHDDFREYLRRIAG